MELEGNEAVKKYKSKPVEIEAVKFYGSKYWLHIAKWTVGKFHLVAKEDRGDDPDIIAEVFDTLHNTWVGVKRGQFIIKGTKGEFYPCDPEVFAEKYEEVK